MNDIQTPHRQVGPALHRPSDRYASGRRVLVFLRRLSPSRSRYPVAVRAAWGLMVLVMLFGGVMELYVLRKSELSYELSPRAATLLEEPNHVLTPHLKYDSKAGVYEFNKGYQPGIDVKGQNGAPKFTASFNAQPDKGTTITDPVTQTSVTFKPDFDLAQPRQEANRLVYPLRDQDGMKIYTLKATGFKEDIILNKYQGKERTFRYNLELPDGTEARMESDGSMSIYGVSPTLLGNVATSTEKDVELLKKARQSGAKNTLLFRFPAPFIVESNRKTSEARAWFGLKDNVLTVYTANMDTATYPLSIDPSVYVETASKLMRGNNETNIDFDVSNELIQKGVLTGARIPSWTSTLSLPSARWNHGTAVAGGYVYAVGGSSGSTNVSTVSWAKLDTSNYTVTAPNPGNGACANWCNDSSYNLPAARAGLSLVAYNGYLYAMGGVDGAGARSSTVYIAKIGANGEPSLWHPTDSNQANWVYWYTSSVPLTSERSYAGAVAYNNRLYLLGGQTNASTGGVSTVEYANINPIGTFSSWTTTGMVALPSVRHNHNIQAYNDRLYLIGGNSAGTLQSSVHYIKLKTDGTFDGSWVSTTAFGTARMAWGGTFTTIWSGYMYVAGGCSAVNGSGYCTAIRSDIQVTSINADGSLTDWSDMIGVTNSRIGYGLVAWRNTLYGVGGCTAQNTTTGACTTTSTTVNYGRINQDGDVSTVNTTQAYSASAQAGNPCSGFANGSSSLHSCDLPPAGDSTGQGGRMSSMVVLNNGFIYNIGGCTNVSLSNECTNGSNTAAMSGNVSYAAIAADGTLVAPASCPSPNTFVGTWCVDATRRINGTTGLGTSSFAVFNNVVYIIGGTDGSNWNSNVYRIPLNADGSLSSGGWQTQTFANLALGTARGYSYAFTRANPASAGTYPGNLYVLGGCHGGTTADGIGCTTYFTEVYKCNILTSGALEELDANDCTTTGQLQIDAETTGGSQGLGLMAGTVYANYVYLIAGSSPNEAQRDTVIYAKIDNSNNIVAVTGTTWVTSASAIDPPRRRGYSFGYNGYVYTLAGHDGTNCPGCNPPSPRTLNDILFAKVDVSDGSIADFYTSSVFVTDRWDFKAIVANGFAYVVGGCSSGAPPSSCTAMTGSIQTFQLYNNYSGSPAAYNTGNTIGVDRIGGSATVMNGYIYYAGGCTNTNCSAVTDSNYYAQLDANGIIGTWTQAGNNLPASVAWGKLVNVGGTLYYVGGQNAAGTAQTAVYYSTPASGVPGAWATAGNVLPAARTELAAAVWNNRIYVSGGQTGGTDQTTVYASPNLSGGGNITTSWTSTGMTVLPIARMGHTMVAYAGNLYVMGGSDGTNYLNDVIVAKVNADGTVGSWTYTTSLPQRVRNGDGFAANGYLYLFGGRSASTTCTNNTYVAPVSANTTIASGNNPTGIGEWSQTNVKFAGTRYGAATAYYDGKAYVLGGACTSFVSAGERTYYSALQSQPQVAKYSYAIDTDTDVFPTQWLMNGLDNDIGARWQMRYRSSTAAAAAWGIDTNFGTVTLGQPEAYIPRDGAGTNTNFARYYYLSVSIDSSQAFGYPEDVTRGPTIADLSIFFTSDPSKRLRHGKTFTGGQLQPLDTPFP